MAPPSRIRIPQHVFGYSLALIPPICYAIYYQRNHPSDEEFEEILRENYSHNIRQSESRRDDMQKLFENLKNGDFDANRKLLEVIQGGKADVKRSAGVDTTLFGTDAGVKAKETYEQEKQEKKKRVKKKKNEATPTEKKTESLDKELVVKVAAVGTVAAVIAALLFGRNRSSR